MTDAPRLTEGELADLRKIAEAANHDNDGQAWHLDPGVSYESGPSVFYPVENDEREVIAANLSDADADFIAAFDPPTVLRLLDTLADRAGREGEWHPNQGPHTKALADGGAPYCFECSNAIQQWVSYPCRDWLNAP